MNTEHADGAAPDARDGFGDLALGEGNEWRRVSPKYLWVHAIQSTLGLLVGLAGGILIVALASEQVSVVLRIGIPIALLLLIVNGLLVARRVKSIRYALRRDDFVFRHGLMFSRVVAVPYGRLQLVDVTQGPVERMLGVSTLKFVTAAVATGVKLPGLPDAEAEWLRDELVRLAETRRAGL